MPQHYQNGSCGIATIETVRQDEALMRMMDIESLPEEKDFGEDLAKLGGEKMLSGTHRLCARGAGQVKKIQPEDIQTEHGFIPFLHDGTLLERSWFANIMSV